VGRLTVWSTASVTWPGYGRSDTREGQVLKHEWTFAATEQGRGSFVIGVCGVCGLVRTTWVPGDQHEGKLDLRGDCPGAPQTHSTPPVPARVCA
jgi:hypothetical protein